MSVITLNILDTYLPTVFTLNVISGYNEDWKLVPEVGDLEFYINYFSHAIVRTVLAMTFCVAFRFFLSRCLGERKVFRILTVATDIASYVISQMFPTSLILAMIVLLSYAIIACRFIYDVIVTGHGLNWLLHQTRCLVKECERKERKSKALQKISLSNCNLSQTES